MQLPSSPPFLPGALKGSGGNEGPDPPSFSWAEPFFVGSAFLRESSAQEDEDGKIYFFFSEAGKEFDFFEDTVVSRVARVCKVRGM